MSENVSVSSISRFKPYFIYLLPVKWHFICALLAGVVYGISSGFGLPFLVNQVFPVFFGEAQVNNTVQINPPAWIPLETFTIAAHWYWVFAIALLPITFFIRGVSSFSNVYLINHCGLYVLERIRLLVFKKLQELDLKFYFKYQSGDLVSRIVMDTAALQDAIITVANDMVKQPITFLAAMGALVWMVLNNPNLTFILVGLVIIPICVFPIRYVGKCLYRRAGQMQKEMGDITGLLTENLLSPQEIRAYNLEEIEYKKFDKKVKQLFGFRMKVVKYSQILTPIIEFISVIGISISVYLAAKSDVSIEEIIAVVFALYMCYEPIKKLGGIHNKLKKGAASLDRLEKIIDHPIATPDVEFPHKLNNCKGRIDFESVTFAYDEDVVLSDINVSIQPGEVIALVGPSGAGKSSFAKLIPRLFSLQAGRIKVDGLDITKISAKNLRENIAIVSQDPVLFNDSLLNNIRLGKPDISEMKVIEAAKSSFAHEFIAQMDDGYHTVAGERGSRLSGGQKQRIAIARAFVKDAPILIMDEATSALDSEKEAQIQTVLKELVKGKTTFIIAHRFSTIKLADRILVFDQGKLLVMERTRLCTHRTPCIEHLLIMPSQFSLTSSRAFED